MSTFTLIKHIRRRSRPLGIGTAADYLRELEVCLGGRCPSGLLDGVSRRQWRAWLKAARRKLVYHHAEMRPLTEGVRQQASGVRPLIPDAQCLMPADGGPALASSLVPPYGPNSHESGYPPHTLATFPAVITTTRQDLDGDVLETAGAELDPRAPLLWQHLPDLPIGRLLDVGERTQRRLTGTFSIADTALGQDAALLAEHGALRISHGFLPTKWQPLDGDDAGRNGTASVPYSGYHILQFKILEVSLVSVPSNPDAVIEAFSRAKLAHPLVKAWAGARFEKRPVVVSGADLQPRVGWDQRACERRPTEEKALGDRRWALGQASTAEVPTPNAQSLTPSVPAQPTNDPVIPEIQSMNPTLHQKAGRALNAVNERRVRAARFHFKAIEHHDDGGDDVADLARKATLPLDDMLDQLNGDGSNPKSGRVVSQENAERLAEAIQHGGAIAQHEQATAEVSALASGAVKHLNAVLDSQDDDGAMSYHDGNPSGCSTSTSTSAKAVAGAETGRVGSEYDQTALPASRCPGAPVQPGHRVAATSVSIETVDAPRFAPATQSPTPNPQSPNPNPQSPNPLSCLTSVPPSTP